MSLDDVKIQSDAIVLLSGGMDSTTLLYYAKRIHDKIYALIIDYNQRHRKEIEHAKKICDLNNILYEILVINIPVIAGSPLVDANIDIPDQTEDKQSSTIVPLRNSLFLLHACIHAIKKGASDVYIAAVADDQQVYPDCRPTFFQAFQNVLNTQDVIVTIRYPFVTKSKTELIALGEILNVPWKLTWTCYHGHELACGKCDACKERLDAFEANKLQDPIAYE